MSDRAKGIACIVASAFGFAVMATCVRLCDDCGGTVSSFQKSFFRNVVALAIALVAFLRGSVPTRKQGPVPTSAGSVPTPNGGVCPHAQGGPVPTSAGPVPIPMKAWLLLIMRSLLGTVGIFANFYALSRITIAEGQTLNKTAPFFTVVFAALFLKERAGWKSLGPLLVAFAGVLLIAKPGFAGEAAFPLAIGLLGGLSAGAAYTALHALGKLGAMKSSFIILFFSAFSCLAAVPFMLHRFDPMTAAQVAVLFGAGGGAALGQFGVTLAYRFAAPRDIAVYDYSNILFTAALGFVLFGQVPDAWSLVGFALIIAAALRIRTGA